MASNGNRAKSALKPCPDVHTRMTVPNITPIRILRLPLVKQSCDIGYNWMLGLHCISDMCVLCAVCVVTATIKYYSYPNTGLDRPWRLWEASRIPRQSTQKVGNVVSLTYRSCLPHKRYSFQWRVISRRKGLSKCRIPVTPSGIEPVNFRIVALCLNQLVVTKTFQQ